MPFALPARAPHRAPAPRTPALPASLASSAWPTLARCAGACTCGGTCGKAEATPDDELGHLLRSAVAARTTEPPPAERVLTR